MQDKEEQAASVALHCVLLRSPGGFGGGSQIHNEQIANKNLGMAGKSSPMFDEGSWFWV